MHLESSSTGKNRILRAIARIGSLPFQEKACLQATSQEYVLLDELIETTLSRAELEVTNEVLATKWSQAERDALRKFVDRVNQLFDQIAWQDENLTLASIINEDPSMQMIRDAANECLRQVRVSFSVEELLTD
jgi:2C-methyl-D-erythritol 2,4-cyclodiphosphate synthase